MNQYSYIRSHSVCCGNKSMFSGTIEVELMLTRRISARARPGGTPHRSHVIRYWSAFLDTIDESYTNKQSASNCRAQGLHNTTNAPTTYHLLQTARFSHYLRQYHQQLHQSTTRQNHLQQRNEDGQLPDALPRAGCKIAAALPPRLYHRARW